MDYERMISLLHALVRAGVAFKVIGGVAMNIQGLARATRDLDIFVEPTPENIARLRTVQVATRTMLFEMKRSTVRPRDRIDAEWLRSRLDHEEG